MHVRQLEDIVDRKGLSETIHALAEVCESKAMHINDNWQDRALARRWDKISVKLYELARMSYNI